MKDIKLVAIDLDDTLLRDDLSISGYTRDVIKKVKELGVAVTLATGRMFRSARPFAQQLGFDVPLITYQGALIKNAFSEDIIYCCPLPAETALQVIEFGRKKQIQVNFYLDDNLYVERITAKGEHYAALAKVPFCRVDDLSALLQRGNPFKCLMIESEDVLDRYAEELREIIGDKAHITKSKPNYLEVIHPKATKEKALRELACWLNIEREQVMAIGDSYNDLEMLEFAGLSVAVANACPDVLRCASYVTASNNEDGVARALDEFILKEAGKTIC